MSGWRAAGVGRRTDHLFMIGSACFALASVPGLAAAVPAAVVGVTYFVGSLFFTTAGYFQFVSSSNPDGPDPRSGVLRRAAWLPGRMDWWASVVQSAGTLWFNVNTFRALDAPYDVEAVDQQIWKPDFFGSIAFLVASALAIRVVNQRRSDGRRSHDEPWRSAWLNMLGSIFFMASALAAFVLPSTGDLVDASLANTGTLLGAICFFVAAQRDAARLRREAA